MPQPTMITITDTFTVQRLWLEHPKLVTAKDQSRRLLHANAKLDRLP